MVESKGWEWEKANQSLDYCFIKNEKQDNKYFYINARKK